MSLIEALYNNSNFLKCSHRGGMGLYPENTLIAFSESIKNYSLDMIELDLQFTKDRKVIVLHDDSIDRTTNGNGRVVNLNYSEIEKYDAGYNFYSSNKGHIYRGQGIKIPLFEEVLKNYPNIYLNIELKHNSRLLLYEVVKLINKYNFEKKIIIGSGKYYQNYRIRKLLPNACHYLSRLELYLLILFFPFNLFKKYWSKFHVVEAPLNYFGFNVYKIFIKISKKINKPLIFWGANNIYTIKLLSSHNSVKGIITDFPNYFINEE